MPQLPWKDESRKVHTNDVMSMKKGSNCKGIRREKCHVMSHTLYPLNIASDYEAVLRVKNIHGWSPDSDIFLFSTRKGN